MAIRFACVGCHARIRLPDGAAGRNVQCPKCGRRQTVPASEGARSADDAPADAPGEAVEVAQAEPVRADDRPEASASGGGLFDAQPASPAESAAPAAMATKPDEAHPEVTDDAAEQPSPELEALAPEGEASGAAAPAEADIPPPPSPEVPTSPVASTPPPAAASTAPRPAADAETPGSAPRPLPMTGSARRGAASETPPPPPRSRAESRLPITPGGLPTADRSPRPGGGAAALRITTAGPLPWVLRSVGCVVAVAALVAVLSGGVTFAEVLALAGALASAVGFCAAGDLAATIELLPRDRP